MFSYVKIFYVLGLFLFYYRNFVSVGSIIIVLSMFMMNINVSKMFIFIWNLSEENIYVFMFIVSVILVNSIVFLCFFNVVKYVF